MSRSLKAVRSIAAVALVAQCAAAHALFTPSETEAFDVSITEYGFKVANPATVPNSFGTQAPASQNLEFYKFDTVLGNLIGARVTFTSAYGVDAGLTAGLLTTYDGGAGQVQFFADGTYDLSLSGAGGLNLLLPKIIAATCTLQDPGSSCDPSPTSVHQGGTYNSAAPIALLPLVDFAGPGGTFILTAALSSTLVPRTDPDNGTNSVDNSTMAGTLAGSWSGTVSVQYEYERVGTGVAPEPTTLYLMLGGALGICLLRRRAA